jgi:hypothetical protein
LRSISLRRTALHLPLRRSERGLLYFYHGLLACCPLGIANFFEESARSRVSNVVNITSKSKSHRPFPKEYEAYGKEDSS